MFPSFEIQRDSDVPAYRQIIERIATLVRAGDLKPGDRVPPERELSAQLGIARGTITKAYEELARSGILEVTRGRGSFISARQDVIPAGRRERAVELIRGLVRELSDLRFTFQEIRTMVDLIILDVEERFENLNVVVVDCSPEALRLFCRQLGFVSRIGIKSVLLGELAGDPRPQERSTGFDLILTTATHYGDVLALAPELKDRVVQLVVSPSQETIISLAGIKPQQSIGVLCQSTQFCAIIQAQAGVDADHQSHCGSGVPAGGGAFGGLCRGSGHLDCRRPISRPCSTARPRRSLPSSRRAAGASSRLTTRSSADRWFTWKSGFEGCCSDDDADRCVGCDWQRLPLRGQQDPRRFLQRPRVSRRESGRDGEPGRVH